MSQNVGVIRDFIGLNVDRPETNIQANEATVAQNVLFSDYSVRKRNGSTRVTPWLCPRASLGFNGNQQYAATAPLDSAIYGTYALGTEFTMEVSGWLANDYTDTISVLVERGDRASDRAQGWVLQFDRQNKLFAFGCALSAGSDVWLTGTWSNFSEQKPFHLAVRRDGANIGMWLKDDEFAGEIGVQGSLTASAVEAVPGSYPVTFASGMANAGDQTAVHFAGRLQEFRTWNYARTTATISEWALKELPAVAIATNSIRFYHKFNEGSGQFAYDHGYIKYVGWSTMTNYTKARWCPSPPEWVDGIVTGGLGDRALLFDGVDDYGGVVNNNDIYATLRTGTENWTVQAVVSPGEQIQNAASFVCFGHGSHTVGSGGLAFRFRAAIDRSVPSYRFEADLGFVTETVSLADSTDFDAGSTYGLILQKSQQELRFRVDNLSAGTTGAWTTDSVVDATGPGFGVNQYLVVGAEASAVSGEVVKNRANATIDELRIFRGLHDPALDVQYAAPDADLLGYWKFNDGSGVTVSDATANREPIYLFPGETDPPWAAGWVEPVDGADVLGLHYYQDTRNLNSLNDARERSLLVNAGACLWRNEGGKWNELLSNRDGQKKSTAAQCGNFMAICNGRDGNLLYDGDLLWKNGITPPENSGTATIIGAISGVWDTHSSGWAYGFGFSGVTAVDKSRTEPGYTWNDRKFHSILTTATIETTCERYHRNLSFPTTMMSHSSTSSVIIQLWSLAMGVGSWNMKKGYLEGAVLQLEATGTYATASHTIKLDNQWTWPNQPEDRWVYTFDSVDWNRFANPTSRTKMNLVLEGHFVWKTATHQVFSTTSYQQISQVGTLAGHYYYCHTNYNRYTGIESNPSDPTYDKVSPNYQLIEYTCDTETNTSVTDRRVYRTLRDAQRLTPDYYFIGTMTGTGYSSFIDNVPLGQEGELMSLYRAVPPKASVCKTFKSRVWYNSVDYPNFLYFSTPLKPAEVDDYNFLVFGDQSDPITALGCHFDSLIVFKRRSTWMLSRADIPAGMRPVCINRSVGCVSHHSVVEGDDELYFLSERGVYALRGTSLRRISSGKIQWYIDRVDPTQLDQAVATSIQDEGVYRLNLCPGSSYADGLRSKKNPWQLDYHYRAGIDGRQYPMPIWSWSDREVCCYGDYVDRYGMRYPAYGDYRGAVCLDNMPDNYTDGHGWYRGSAVWSTTGAVGDDPLSAGAYTVTVNGGTLHTRGHGLKGLVCHLVGGSTSETLVVYSNTSSEIVFQTPTVYDYEAGDHVFIAPIRSRYKTGWMDFGSTLADQMVAAVKLDYRLQTTTSTLTTIVRGGRPGSRRTMTAETHTIDQSYICGKLHARNLGKHIQLELQHDWPGESFEIFNWEFLVEGAGRR